MSDGDTIYAPASGKGRAGIAVIRVSGPGAGAAVEALTGKALPEPRRAVVRALVDPETGTLLDRALVVWMPGPASYTGEDAAELHVHGGRAVIDGVLAALSALAGCRMAEPGEFSRRAVFNGRFDLAQIEGLADLVAAETEAQRRQALAQMDGALSRVLEGWRQRLLRAAAHLEAAIDFADEDLPEGLEGAVLPEIAAIREEIEAHLRDNRRGERLRDGISIAILGAPNVGKSSLLNALARREAAIVSETAGTTRDVIEVHLDLGGYPVILADTAGIRAAMEGVEEEGIRRALARAEAADIRLVLTEAPSWPMIGEATRALVDDSSLIVLTKADLKPVAMEDDSAAVAISVKTGEGLEVLVARLVARVAEEFDTVPDAVLTRARHREALEACAAALQRYLAQPDMAAELAAEEANTAIRALGRITGKIDIEDYLDVIFQDFCIGK